MARFLWPLIFVLTLLVSFWFPFKPTPTSSTPIRVYAYSSDKEVSRFLENRSDFQDSLVAKDDVLVPVIGFWKNKQVSLSELDNYIYKDDMRYHPFFDALTEMFTLKGKSVFYLLNSKLQTSLERHWTGPPLQVINFEYNTNFLLLFFIVYNLIILSIHMILKQKRLLVWFLPAGLFILKLGLFPFVLLLSLSIWAIVYQKHRISPLMGCLIVISLLIPNALFMDFRLLLWSLWTIASLVAFVKTLSESREVFSFGRVHQVFEPVQIIPRSYSVKAILSLMLASTLSLLLCSFSLPSSETTKALESGEINEIKEKAQKAENLWQQYSLYLENFISMSLYEDPAAVVDSSSQGGSPLYSYLKDLGSLEVSLDNPFQVSLYVIYWYLTWIVLAYLMLFRKNHKPITIFS